MDSGFDFKSKTEQIKADTRRTVEQSAQVRAQAVFVITTTADLVANFYRRNPKFKDGGRGMRTPIT